MSGDEFYSVRDEERAELKVEGSHFIAESFQVSSREAAQRKTEVVARRERRATHHCTAFRVGADGNTYYYDDDGEPSGTAGQPILRQIDGRNLTNTLVVVTRYFGGVKLGTGGLSRAYGDAASAVLERSGKARHVLYVPLIITFDYTYTANVEQLLKQFDAQQLDADYTDVTQLQLAVRKSQVDRFLEMYANKLGGQGEVVVKESSSVYL